MANSAVVGLLRVLLTMDTAEFSAAARKASGEAQAWSKSFGNIGRQASSIGAKMTAGLTLPMLGAAAAAIKTGMDFEKTLNQINGVLTPTAQQMELVRATAIKMGADTAFSATDAAEAILELGKAGFDTNTAISSVGQVLELAAASGLSMGDSASLAARSLNAFGLEASALAHVNDVLAKAVNTTSLEIDDLQTGFQYIGPIAQGFGMSIESASAALGVMRDAGIAAETSGRALREGLSRLANPVKSVEDVIAQLGLSLDDVNPSMHSLSEIVGTLQDKGLTAAESLKLFGDAAGPGMFALVQKGQVALDDLTIQLEKSEGAAKKMADSMMQGIPGAMERLKGSVETAMLAVEKAIEPAAITVIGFGESIADMVTKVIVPAFMALPQPVQTGALALAGLVAIAGPAIYVFGQLALAAQALTTAFAANGIATLAMGNAARLATTYLPTFTGWLGTLAGSLALSTGAVATLSAVLLGLGTIVALVGAAFTGWSIGKWIGEITGLTDSVGKLSARFLEFIGYLPKGTAAQYDAMRAAERAKQAQDGLNTSLNETVETTKKRLLGEDLIRDVNNLEAALGRLTTEGKATPDVLRRVGMEAAGLKARGATLSPALQDLADKFSAIPAPAQRTAGAVDEAAEAFKRLQDQLSGKDQIAEAQQLVAAIASIGGATKLTTAEQQHALGVLDAVIEKYDVLGTEAPADLMALRNQIAAMPDLELRVSLNKSAAGEAVADLKSQMEMWRDFRLDTKLLIPSTGIDLASVMEPFKKAVKSAIEPVGFWKGAVTSFGEAISTQLGPAILGAFQGGGNVAKSIGASIGGIFTTSILGTMKDGKFTDGIGKMLQGTLGKTFGGLVASFLPGIGTLLGGLAGNLFGKLFGGVSEDVRKARQEVDQFQKSLAQNLTAAQRQAAGHEQWKMTVIAVRDAYLGVGRSAADAERIVRQMWDTSNPARARAAMEEINRVFEEFKGRQAEASSLFDQIMDAGQNGIPAAMRPALESLIQLGLLTDEQVAKLTKLGDGSVINVDQLESDLESIHGRLESLGPAFQQAKIDQTAGKYINSIQRMIDAGGDVGGILFDAQEEISALVQESLKFGTTLPANMKPWIEELARAGLLVDANGQKLTDLANLKWGDKIETEAEKQQKVWDDILKAIQALVAEIRGPLLGAINSIPDEKRIKVGVDYEDGGPPDRGSDEGFATGTLGRFGRFWANFREGSPTILHGTEAVITKAQAIPFALSVLDGMLPRMPASSALSPTLSAPSLSASLPQREAPTNVSTSTTNWLPAFMPTHARSTYDMAREFARYLATSGLATDAEGVTTAIEHLFEQWDLVRKARG